MKARALLGIVLIAASAGVGAAPDAVHTCLGMARSAIEAVGDSRAGEVQSSRSELMEALVSLEPWANRLAAERAALESDQQRLDVHNRERDHSLQLLEHQERVVESDVADWRRRYAGHEEELQAANLECNGPLVSELVIANCKTRFVRINETARQANAEAKALRAGRAEIVRKRKSLTNDAAQDARRIDELLARRAHLDRGAAKILGECAAGQSRALALKQIVHSPARTVAYQSPNAVAEQVVLGLFQAVAKQGALNATEIKMMRRAFVKAGLATAVKKLNVTYAAADMLLDTANAGVDQRLAEVTRNLFLVGDYAAVMKEMVDRKSAGATSTPGYIAMRKEIERLARDMPSTRGEMLVTGLFSAAALGEAFASVAGQYASKSVAHTGNAVVRRVDIPSRLVHGKGGIAFYREAINAMVEGGADEATKNGAKHIMFGRGNGNEIRGGQ